MVSRFLLNNWINGNKEGWTQADYISLINYFETAADTDYNVAEELIDETIVEE